MYISVYQMKLGDLDYLNKIEEIQGIGLGPYSSALYIAENAVLTALDLNNLKTIGNGRVVVRGKKRHVFFIYFKKCF